MSTHVSELFAKASLLPEEERATRCFVNRKPESEVDSDVALHKKWLAEVFICEIAPEEHDVYSCAVNKHGAPAERDVPGSVRFTFRS